MDGLGGHFFQALDAGIDQDMSRDHNINNVALNLVWNRNAGNGMFGQCKILGM